MPELPEMHAYRQKIETEVGGAELVESTFTTTKRLNVPADEIASAIDKSRLNAVERSGKEILLRFDGGDTLGIHLMITGKFVVGPADQEPPGGRVASFKFDNGKTLHVRDRKRLAKFKLNPEPATAPDALSAQVDANYLRECFAKQPRTNVKTFLMDQDRIGGIGNAYSDEILWASRIAPQSKCGKLPDDVVETLAATIHDVLTGAVDLVGSLEDPLDYREARNLSVHDPNRDTSPNGAEITTATIAGRTAYFTDEQVMYA
ncbi:MAG TPA: DNA-formamidopyrimidine glycosylase family protein [Solirubrobacterales bacterium]|jgi:formamidopyrimidine-DNA glycosylase|nr:DNA-formamidopyrimidine glycosylase family protein [Solirubrobacterales bacterium]